MQPLLFRGSHGHVGGVALIHTAASLLRDDLVGMLRCLFFRSDYLLVWLFCDFYFFEVRIRDGSRVLYHSW